MDKEIIIYNKDVLKDMKREIAEELQALYRLFPKKYSASNTMKFMDDALMKLAEEYDGTDKQYIDFWVLGSMLGDLWDVSSYRNSVVNAIIISE